MAHRPETTHAPTKIMKPVKVKKTSPAPVKVSNWWYAVGFVGGAAVVGTFWWYIYPLIVSLFY